MVLEPKFVMLDEPTSALDMSVQAQIVDLLRDLQKKHDLAYLFISHDLKVVRALCNYVIVMHNGKVVEEGPADEIFANPKDDYTKALLAAAFNLSVLHRDGARRLIARQAKEDDDARGNEAAAQALLRVALARIGGDVDAGGAGRAVRGRAARASRTATSASPNTSR